MRFTVEWVPDAEQELAALWTAAADRRAVTEGVRRIDLRLEADPLTAGESRPRHRRILFDPPLVVIFQPDATDRAVKVLTVGWSGRPA